MTSPQLFHVCDTLVDAEFHARQLRKEKYKVRIRKEHNKKKGKDEYQVWATYYHKFYDHGGTQGD